MSCLSSEAKPSIVGGGGHEPSRPSSGQAVHRVEGVHHRRVQAICCWGEPSNEGNEPSLQRVAGGGRSVIRGKQSVTCVLSRPSWGPSHSLWVAGQAVRRLFVNGHLCVVFTREAPRSETVGDG